MYETKRVNQIFEVPQAGASIRVNGWIRTKRDSKAGFSFIELNDGSCLKNIQIIADGDIKGADQLPALGTGAAISVDGVLVASPGKGQSFELKADRLVVHGLSDGDFPMQKKRHSFEFLRTIPHLRIRSNTFGAVTRVRNALCYAMHKFFQERDFLWIHTPIITTSDCEGAGEVFQVTTFPLSGVPVKDGQVDYGQDFFGKPVYLTVSGQLAVEAYSCCFNGVYTFGPTFRSENSNTSRHLSEFWMVEPEIAFADLNDDFKLSVDFLKYIFGYVLDNCREDMAFFDKWILKGVTKTLADVVESPFEKIDYTEAIKLLEGEKGFEFEPYWGCNLQAEHERFLTEKKIGRPVAVVNYPKDIKSFYMHLNDDGKTVAAMDVLVPRIGEIIGGSQRESRAEVLKRRIEEMELEVDDYGWYLDLRRWGTVPHAGFGIGLERAVQYVTGMTNIRDVIPYPRAPKLADF